MKEHFEDIAQAILLFVGGILLLFLLSTFPAEAQTIQKEGIVIKAVESKKDTLVTVYRFEDSKGFQYPIILNKKNGKFYIWKRSSKTGRMYRYYFPSAKQEEMKRLMVLF